MPHKPPQSNQDAPDNVYSLEDILAEYTHRTGSDQVRPIPLPHGEGDAKIIPFPTDGSAGQQDDPSPLTDGLRRLRQAEDTYVEQMFAEETPSPEEQLAEALIPGVDRETTDPPPSRRPKRTPEEIPDLAPQELAQSLRRGLPLLRLRTVLVFLLALPALGLAAAPALGVALPAALTATPYRTVYLSAGILGLALSLSLDVPRRAFSQLFQGKPGPDLLVTLSCAAALADALTLPHLTPDTGRLPYCACAVLALAFSLRGNYLLCRGHALSCRTAASGAEPYLVTLDEGRWNNRDAYTKHSGPAHGFGRQIQDMDGARRVFCTAAPLLLLGCVLLSLISSLGQHRPEHMVWCLSALLTAATPLAAGLCYALPMDTLARRLAKCGAALAGWPGVRWSGRNNGILLTDWDLFPPGSVTLNGIKVFGDLSVEKVVAITATLLRDTGSGLAKLFQDLLRTQGGALRHALDLCCYEGGGISAVIRGEQVLVGTASFMTLMEIPLPQGLHVKNAVFCAVDGTLAGIFALNYTLPDTISPALSALIANRVGPVLATRDFNLIPAMLKQKFKLPVERMGFPPVTRRMELSAHDQTHSAILTAVLCREGLGPFSDSVVGAQRLRSATRLSAGLACAGAVVGLLFAFYLTFEGSFSSLSVLNLTVFLLLWAAPTLLISGWVDRY